MKHESRKREVKMFINVHVDLQHVCTENVHVLVHSTWYLGVSIPIRVWMLCWIRVSNIIGNKILI